MTRSARGLLPGLLIAAVFSTIPLQAADWPQWGGSPERNMVCGERGLPSTFEAGKKTDGQIDPATTQNVRWTARLGTAAYGNPTVSGGRVFVGTDIHSFQDDPSYRGSQVGLVKCLDERTGELLWQLATPKRTHGLPRESHFGLQKLGVCSSPTVDGDRVYVVTSGGDILCLDVDGLADGNDGPFVDEGQYIAGHGNPPVKLGPRDGDIIWRFDPIDELGVCPHDCASCSVLVHGDVVYTGTSNGVGGKPGSDMIGMHAFVVNPEAPAFIALDKHTGRLLARENGVISPRLWHAQWSSPSLGRVGDKTLVLLGGGDGFCYAFEALGERPEQPVDLKLVWSYDCNPPEYRCPSGEPVGYYEGDRRKKGSPNHNDGKYLGPSQVIATPVFHEGRVYVAIGQDPAHGRGRGLLHCIDATGTGDITQTGCVWKYDGIERTIATAAVCDGLVYLPDLAGKLHCLDAETGECRWVYDTKGETWGGVLVADGKLFLGNKRDFFVFAAGPEARLLSEIRLGSPAYSTPVAANGTLYVASQHYLWAVSGGP